MTKPLDLLLVEDSEDDAALLLRELTRSGYAPSHTRVETPEAMVDALDAQKWDVVISDYSMPNFSAPEAIALMKSRSVDAPLIVISGSIGEERAVSLLQAGAHDFIIKGKTARLGPIIERALRDVEDRRAHKRAEQALLESEQSFHELADAMPQIVWTAQSDGSVDYYNQRWVEYTGMTIEETKGWGWKFFLHPEELEACINLWTAAVRSGQNYQAEFRLKLALDGTYRWHLIRGIPIREKNGNIRRWIGTCTDIHDLKLAQEQLRQAQKMEVIGQLAGGIAHDFNNLLTVIIGQSELALDRLAPNEDMNCALKQIHQTGKRAASLTRQLLAFSRRQILEPKVLDFNAVLVEMEDMLKMLIPENVSFSLSCEPGLRRVRVDRGQLEQVVMNLVINARDSILSHGKIMIETANVNLDVSYCHAHAGVKAGHYVMLAVSDTGCGMTEQIKAHIFEPFFTTKEQGKGTGLGLATVYGIIKQSGGQIEVYSESGKGTTFKIYFPQVAGEIEATQSSQTLAVPARGNEVILLVEDDEGVRELVYDILKIYGYSVLTACHGREALEVCDRYKGPIHLLITDMVMPEMNGPELAERVRAIRPEKKVLFTSGYTEHAIVNNGMLAPKMHFLHKPFSPSALARKVREVLDMPDAHPDEFQKSGDATQLGR